MIRSILYATDLGLSAPFILQHALALTRAFNASLYVVHAVEHMGLFAESVLQTYLDEERLKELRSNGLNTVMASIEQRVLEGFRDEAQKLGLDLLVLGSHSHGADMTIPLGRTAS
jgi:nucleotide-binding universal stress UspA family protein